MRFIDNEANFVLWLKEMGADYSSIPLIFEYSSNYFGLSPMTDHEVLVADPATWLRNQSPNLWKAPALASKKHQFLDEAAAVAGPPILSDPAEVEIAWNELVTLANVTPNPGATNADLKEFKETTGYDMPEGLASLLQLSNGATGAFDFRDLMSVSQITSEWKFWKEIFDASMLTNLFTSYKSDKEQTIPIYTNPQWVPFVDESTGNFAAVDLLPGPAGRHGQIIYFGTDQYKIRQLATDITGFLNQEITHLKANTDHEDSWF